MRRTVTEDKGYVPDYEFSQRQFKKRLGILERDSVRGVSVRGDRITVEMSRSGDERVRYECGQAEFKERLGITDRRTVLFVYASVWSGKVQISLSAAAAQSGPLTAEP